MLSEKEELEDLIEHEYRVLLGQIASIGQERDDLISLHEDTNHSKFDVDSLHRSQWGVNASDVESKEAVTKVADTIRYIMSLNYLV